MSTSRRVYFLLLFVIALGIPAAVLRGLCIGDACDDSGEAATGAPFCSLPNGVRSRIEAGFRDGRSPDVLVVTEGPAITGASGRPDSTSIVWPAVNSDAQTRVPIVFSGAGVVPAASLPEDMGLDDVAPTVARIIQLQRPHPEVRSGNAVEAVADGRTPQLVVVVAWKGIGATDLEGGRGEWPYLARLLASGVGTMQADTGSLPASPTATLTTVGTGGLPRQHGIVARVIRNDSGRLVRAWSSRAPVSIIATLGDDLDELRRQEPLIGMVARDPADRGIIGRNWYLDGDKDDVEITPGDPVARFEEFVASGYGSDDTTDLVAIVDEGPLRELDRRLRSVVAAATEASDGSVLVVVAGTGSSRTATGETVTARDVVADLEARVTTSERIVEAAVAGGFFLDQEVLSANEVSEDEVTRAIRSLRTPEGKPLVADVFSGTAVSFGRYC